MPEHFKNIIIGSDAVHRRIANTPSSAYSGIYRLNTLRNHIDALPTSPGNTPDALSSSDGLSFSPADLSVISSGSADNGLSLIHI